MTKVLKEVHLTTPIPSYRTTTTTHSDNEESPSKNVYGFKRITPESVQVTTPYPVQNIAVTARSDSGEYSTKKRYGFKFLEPESRKDSFPTFSLPV